MLPEIISYNKSLECRLQEYEQLLENVESPCSDVVEIWGSIFEDLTLIEPDWQALWMLSEENCQKYNLLHPTAVIVNVNDFKWEELLANVSVLAVQEDIVLPSSLDVSVLELHPIKVQDYDETDLRAIEDWLDKARYFFRHLWYPWDAKLNVSMMDWCDAHLNNRLMMQYDLKTGVFDKTIANYLKLLLFEAHSLNSMSENQFCEDEDERLTTVKKYIRKKKIKTELDLFERPELRQGMILLKKKEMHLKTYFEKINNREAQFVWMDGDCESLIEHLKMAHKLIGKNVFLKVSSSLQVALDSSNTNDMILLPPGHHVLSKFTGIENGGVIRGFNKADTIVAPDVASVPRAILFDCFGSVELANLSIFKPTGIAVQVFDGSVTMSSCRLTSKKSSTSKGIVVLSGSKLTLEDCEVRGFGTGLALQGNTQVTLRNCRIVDCIEGIKVGDDVSLTMHQVEISSCDAFGIRMETSQVPCDIPLVGDLTLLTQNKSCKCTLSSVTFADNKKGDVLVRRSERAYSAVDSGDCKSSSEMICLNDSVTELDENEPPH